MSDPVLVSLIGNGTVILTLVITRMMSWAENKNSAKKLEDIHQATNGMKKQLEQVAFDKGVEQGKQDTSK